MALSAVLLAGLLGEFAYALLLFPLLQRHLVFDRHLATGFPGYVLAAYGGARLLTQAPLGSVANALDRRLCVTLGYGTVLLSGLLCWASGPALIVLVAAALFGAGHALADPLLPAALAEGAAIQRRGRIIALFNLTQVAGLALGLGGALLTDLTPAAAGFVVVAAANAAALALLALGAAPLLRRPPTAARLRRSSGWQALRSERAIDLFVALFLVALAMNLIMPNLNLYSVRRLHEPLHEVIPYLLPAGLAGVAALPLGGWLTDRYGRLLPLLTGSALGAVGFLGLTFAQAPWQAGVAAALAATGLALTMPASNVALLEVAGPDHRELLLSGMMAVQGLGQAVGPLFGGLLTQLSGVALPFGVGAAALWLVTPCAVLFASAPHDGEPGELVPYTPLTRFISRRHLRRHE